MAVRVKIPAPLRRATDGAGEAQLAAGSIADILQQLEEQFPPMNGRLRDEQGKLRRFVNLYVNGEDIRFLSGLDTPVADGDEVSIVPAVAGG